MAAAAALLLVWNICLTVGLNRLRTETRSERSNTAGDDVTFINHTVEGYTTDVTEVAQDVMQALVTVNVISEQSESIFSGVVYSVMGTDTWILTSAKAVSDTATVYVRFDNGLSYEAELRGYDDLSDIALYLTHPEFDVQPIAIGSSAVLKQGEYVLAMGGRNLHTQSGDASFGVVSRAGQRLRSGSDSEWIMETVTSDTAMSPQMEGGVLVNMSGQLVGLLTAIGNQDHSDMTVSVGTSDIVQVADQLRRSGEVIRGYLGVITKDIKELELYQKSAMNSPLDQNSGLVIMGVIDGSPAQEAGLQANDILQSADEVLLSSVDSLPKVLYSHKPEDVIRLSVIRGGTTNPMTVTLR